MKVTHALTLVLSVIVSGELCVADVTIKGEQPEELECSYLGGFDPQCPRGGCNG